MVFEHPSTQDRKQEMLSVIEIVSAGMKGANTPVCVKKVNVKEDYIENVYIYALFQICT